MPSLSTVWETSLPGCGEEITSVLACEHSVYAGCNGYVYRLDPSNGAVLSENGLPGRGHNEVRLATGDMHYSLFVGIDGYVLHLSNYSLKTIWETHLPGCGYGRVNVLSLEGAVYAGCNGFVYRLSDVKGDLLSKFNASNPLIDSPLVGNPEVRLAILMHEDEDQLLVGNRGRVLSLNPMNLKRQWEIELEESVRGVTSVVSRAGLCYVGSEGCLYKIEPKSGAVAEKSNLPGTGEKEVRLALSDDTVDVLVGTNGYGVAADVATLRSRWSVSLPECGYNVTDVAVGRHGLALFGSDGYVYALDNDGHIVATNGLLGRGKYETRLATCSELHGAVFVGINGYVLKLQSSTS